jgi:anti-sigma B factor antagonist
MDGEPRLRVLRREKSSLMPGRGGRQRPLPGQALAMRVQHEPGHVLVTVAGEIDIATVAQLEEQLSTLATSGNVLVADLTQVSFIDAAGLRALGRAAAQAAAHRVTVYVVCGRDHILRLFHLTGLDRRITVARTLTEALQSFPPACNRQDG